MMSAQIIPFPTWDRDKKTIDSEGGMVGWAIWTFCVESKDKRYSFQEAADLGRLLWKTQEERNLNETTEEMRRRLELAIDRVTCGWLFFGRGGSNHIREASCAITSTFPPLSKFQRETCRRRSIS